MQGKFRVLGVLAVLYGLLWSCQSEGYVRTAQYITQGQQIYRTHCQNCHGLKGEGLGALYPSLQDSSRLKDLHSQLPKLIRFGSDTTKFNGEIRQKMPGNEMLTPIEIAYVLTYIQNAFGNELGMYTQEDVVAHLKP
jgi:mono/diheme cytochrome c family protein